MEYSPEPLGKVIPHPLKHPLCPTQLPLPLDRQAATAPSVWTELARELDDSRAELLRFQSDDLPPFLMWVEMELPESLAEWRALRVESDQIEAFVTQVSYEVIRHRI